MTKKTQKSQIRLIITTVFAVMISLILPSYAYSIDPMTAGVLAAHSDDQPETLFGANGIFTTVSNILLFVVGCLGVLMLIIGGIRYIFSGGKEESVTKAKNTILYAIIGIIVALLAYAMINFVIGAILPFATGAGTNV